MARPIFAGLASIEIGNAICRRLCCTDGIFDSAGLLDEIEGIIANRYQANPPRVTAAEAEESMLEEERERYLYGR